MRDRTHSPGRSTIRAQPQKQGPAGRLPRAPPEIRLTAPAKLSAKKLKRARKVTVALSSTGAVQKVSGFLTKGKARVATGSLVSLNGNGRIVLKLSGKAAKSLKAGAYGLSVSGTDEQGRTVGTAIRLKVGR